MTHLHSVNGTEARFSINPATRKISRTSGEKVVLIQGDHNSKRFYFDMPRYIEDHDMSLCNKVEVHYVNIEAKSSATKPGLYEVDDLEIVADDERSVCFTWLVSGNATELIGMLSFLIKFVCTDEEGNSVYKWHTAICSTPEVQGGMCNTEIIVEKYADVLEQWRERLFGNDTVKTVNGVGPDENGNVQIEMEAGVTSWNDLTDKPFGDNTKIITWDGNTEGLEPVGDTILYKFSDEIPCTPDDLNNVYVEMTNIETGSIMTSTPKYAEEYPNVYMDEIGMFVFAFEDAEVEGLSISKGMYINSNGYSFGYSFIMTVGKLKHIDEKFIPDEIARTENVVKKSDLQTAVDEALTQAKESGEFDGADGATWYYGTLVTGTGDNIFMPVSNAKLGDYYLNTDTGNVYVSTTGAEFWKYLVTLKGNIPVKGVDYWTDEDKEEILTEVDTRIDQYMEDALGGEY